MAAIVRNPFRFRHRARSVVVAESSNSYERRRPHPAIISRRSTVSVPPFSTTTAKSLTRSSTDQVRPLDRKLVLFFVLQLVCDIFRRPICSQRFAADSQGQFGSDTFASNQQTVAALHVQPSPDWRSLGARSGQVAFACGRCAAQYQHE